MLHSFASTQAEEIWGHDMKCACLEKRSVMTQITVFPELSDNLIMMSLEISFHGSLGLVTGCRNPNGFPVHSFAKKQMRLLVT